MINLIQCKLSTKIGPLYLVSSPKGLRGVYFKKQPIKLLSELNGKNPQEKNLSYAAKQLQEYFAGKRRKFDLIFDLMGTEFQIKVWRELFKIPYGKTVSYKEIAQRIKNPQAVRAVGTANGHNPLCIIIPCHRVIAADGSLGGYSAGLTIKKKLLEHEQGRSHFVVHT